MSAYQELEKQLIEALEQACSGLEASSATLDELSQLAQHECLRWELIDLMQEFHHQPADELAGMIRQRLVELRFVEETGDSVAESPREQALDLEVKVLVNALEKMRRHALEKGLWGQAQACVPCCG